MARASFLVRGIPRLLNKFKKRERKVFNMKTVNLKAIILIDRWVQQNFRAEGALHENNRFGPWKPLSPSTLSQRRKGSSAILQDTGRLKNSFDFKATNTFAKLGTRVNYSVDHEFGKGRIPQRKILPTDEQGSKIIAPVYKRFVEDLIK